MHHKPRMAFRRCLVLALVLAAVLFYPNSHQKCSAEPAQAHRYITVPFAALNDDSDFSPHQLITVQIHKDKTSPAVSATFFFDTGSTHCVITSRLAAKLGLPQHLMRLPSGKPLKFNGAVTAAVTVASLDVGTLRVKGLDLAVLSSDQLSQMVNQKIDGVLGANFWSTFALRIDFTHRQITFITPPSKSFSSRGLVRTVTELSSAEITHLGFTKAFLTAVVVFQGHPFTLAAVGNGPVSASDIFLVDSGSSLTFLSSGVFKKLKLTTIATHETADISGGTQSAEAWLPSLSSGDLKLRDSLVFLGKERYSLLGLDVLANYEVLFDFPQQKLYLKPRSDLQSVTSRQYESATQAQQRQWATKSLMVTYPTADRTFGIAIPYTLSPDGLPLAQVRPTLTASPAPFLLKTNTYNIYLSSELANQWQIASHPVLDAAGKPQLLRHTEAFREAKLSSLFIGGAFGDGNVAVLPSDGLAYWASYLPVPGVIGASFIYARPLLMNPETQTWVALNHFELDDLPGLGMSDAAAIDILDPDRDGIPALAVQVQQDAAQCTDTMTLATGSRFTLLSAEAAKTLKLTPGPQMLTYGTGRDVTMFNQAHLSQLSIGSVVMKDMLVAYPIGAMPKDFYPRLGMNVISKLRLLVDAPAKKMYVKKASN